MDYSHLLYKRGFLFSKEAIDPPISTWVKKTVGDCFLSFDPESPWAISQDVNDWVLILGRTVDTLNWGMDIQTIANECVARLNYSEERLLDYIDYLSGRFLVIYHHGNRTKFMNDAFGTRSAFYSLHDPVVIASHCQIISDYLNSGASKQMVAIKQDPRWQFIRAHSSPGILTPYEGIYSLTPNTLINVEDREVQRFYPRKELPIGNLPDVAEELAIILRHQLELLHSKYKLALSLSAGLDTRTTLAVARDIAKDVLFFTYGYTDEAAWWDELGLLPGIPRTDVYEKRRISMLLDLATASEISKTLGLKHVCLGISASQDGFKQFNEVLSRNTFYHHARRAAFEYLSRLPSDVLHIRSNISECARAYNRPQKVELPLTPKGMAQAEFQMGDNEIVVEAFHQFSQATDFTNILNFDPYDMFLWEHHEGIWLSYVLLESDVAFDTMELFNSRVLMEKALSVPVEQRSKSAIHYEIIEHLWPVLLSWPINKPSFRTQIEELQTELFEVKIKLVDAKAKLIEKEREKVKAITLIKRGLSYQLGTILVQAITKPGLNTFLLPYRLFCLCLEKLKVRRAKLQPV